MTARTWSGFLSAIREVESARSGSATLTSTSPGELDLQIHRGNTRGALAVRGTVGDRGGAHPWTLSFDGLTLDADHVGASVAELLAAHPG